MVPPHTEKRLLQVVIALACIVPVTAGLSGVLKGAHLLHESAGIDLDSHFRYLCGLLFGIGLGFLSAIPDIENHAARFRLLTVIVVMGGIGRLLGLFLTGMPSPVMQAALVMELVVTPLLCLWQHRVARRFRRIP